jgi:hypothetical protein
MGAGIANNLAWAVLCDTYGVEISPHLFVTPHLLIEA